MKNRYRLQPVLEMRDQARQEAARLVAARRERLAAVVAELQRRERAVDDCQAMISAAQSHLAQKAGQGATADYLVGRRAHLADLKERKKQLARAVAQQHETVAQAEAEVEEAVSALGRVSKDLRAIEKHRESWQQRIRRTAEQRDQKLLDEISAAAHGEGE
jgi:flagellar export protein FliJ